MTPRIVAIIQARMGSKRLPGKILMEIHGRTMLARVVRRVMNAKTISEVVVATSKLEQDDPVQKELEGLQIGIYRGSDEDVLDRYYGAMCMVNCDAVVRITADCPLVDPEVIDKVVNAFLEKRVDYASNTLERTYPRGLDVEVVRRDALERAWKKADLSYERAHVTPYVYGHPSEFTMASVTDENDTSSQRWTVDTREDLEFVRAVYHGLPDPDRFDWRDVLAMLEEEPALLEINRKIAQKELSEG